MISTTTIQRSTTGNVNITTKGALRGLVTVLKDSAFRLGGMRNRRGLEQQQQLHAQSTLHTIQQQQQHMPGRQEQLQKQRSFEKPVNKRMEVDQLWPHETQSERGWVACLYKTEFYIHKVGPIYKCVVNLQVFMTFFHSTYQRSRVETLSVCLWSCPSSLWDFQY